MRNFGICTPYQFYLGDLNKKNQTFGSRDKYGVKERCVQCCGWETPRKKKHCES